MSIFSFDNLLCSIVVSHVILVVIKVLYFFIVFFFLFLLCCPLRFLGSLSLNFLLLNSSLRYSFLLLNLWIKSCFSSIRINGLSIWCLRFLVLNLFLLLRRLWTTFLTRRWAPTPLLLILLLVILINNFLILKIPIKNIFLNLTLFYSRLLD